MEKSRTPSISFESLLDNPNPNLGPTEEITLTEREHSIINTADWLVNPEYIAGFGIFKSGSIDDPTREIAITNLLQDKLEAGEARVHIVHIDDLLNPGPSTTIVRKILQLGENKGVRDEDGKPRAIIVTGFSSSKFLTKEGLEWLIQDDLEKHPQESEELGDLKKQVESTIFPEQTLQEGLAKLQDLPEITKKRLTAVAFLKELQGDFQLLATRKNGPGENIITIIVLPTEALEAYLTYETGHRVRSEASELIFRAEEFMCNV